MAPGRRAGRAARAACLRGPPERTRAAILRGVTDSFNRAGETASYRALLGVPSIVRALAGMQTARIAQSMVGLGLVLFTLEHYRSPELAGLVTFAGIAPGIVVSPIAGALLDRHGRTRLITLDFLIAAASLALIGTLALLGLLPAWLLIAIAALSALTGPLSATGLRACFR
jgi:MFS family permease